VKLSVIIPAYNRATLVMDTIDSILSSGLHDFEIVVVDDGSTDRTPEVVRAMEFPVRYIWQDNGGLASARNTGFAASRGRYVAFLDSDDLWFPGAVPTLLRHLEDYEDIPFIFGDAQMGSPSTGFVSFVETFGGDEFRNLPSREIGSGIQRFDRGPFFRQLARRNVVFLGSMVLRREIIDQVGPFDPFPYGAEDWHFFLRLALRYDFYYCEALPVSAYIQHSTNMTMNQDRMNDGFCKALSRLLEEPGLTANERSHVKNHLKRCEFGYAYPAYDRGDFQAARERFSDCLRSGFGWKPFFYWLACQLPGPVLKGARSLKQRYRDDADPPRRLAQPAGHPSS
jgi:glycosyltransferase involved in cell wall biosynthesis